MNDKLMIVPNDDLPKLRDLYLCNWPSNILGYYTLDNFIQWIHKKPDIKNLRIYSLNGDWSDGTYIIIERYNLFINSLNDTNEQLQAALMLLDWTIGYKINTVSPKHRPPLDHIFESKQILLHADDLTRIYFLPRNKGTLLNVEPPKGITLKTMTDEHAEIADNVWPFKHLGSLFFLKRLIAWNHNVGAFDEDGKLVAWCLRLQVGALGVLQVDKNHLRKGLGSLVCRAITKQLSDMNMDSFACIVESNVASIQMFEKIGFKHIFNCSWISTCSVDSFDCFWA